MSLYPTKTRIALLAWVAKGEVFETGGESYIGTTGGLKVTDRIGEQRRAGWVEPGVSVGYTHSLWAITDAGRQILAGGPR